MKSTILTTLTILLLMVSPAAAQHTGHAHAHPAPADSIELKQQLEALRLATAKYRDHSVAVSEGFRLFGAEGPLMGEHWYHPERVREPFDVARPSTLQYAWIDGRRELVGVAYTVYRRAGEPLPEGFAGQADHWHVHDVARIARTVTADRPLVRMLVDRNIRRGRAGGGDGRTLLTMVHAWPWLDNPDGPFAQLHRALPYLRAKLPVSFAYGAGEDAAWGVSLLAPGACEGDVRRIHALAGLSGEQRARLGEACGAAAAVVLAVFEPAVPADALNAAAAAAWRRYGQARDALLTPEQRARLDVATEHDPGMGGK